MIILPFDEMFSHSYSVAFSVCPLYNAAVIQHTEDIVVVADEDFLEMLHRLTDEEKVSIFSCMILMEKWRLNLTQGTELSQIFLNLHLR